MNREEKAASVEMLNDKFKEAPIAILAHYRGLSVEQMSTLRREVRAADGEVLVAKNRLARLAVKDTPYEPLTELLSGPSALAFGYSDPVGVAKALQDFAEDNEALEIKGAVMEGEAIDAAKVKQLASMPTRDELRAKLLALMMTPAQQFVRVLAAPAQQFLQVLSARIRQENP